MTRLAPLLVAISLTLSPGVAAAQETPADDSEIGEGLSLLQRGARTLLRGLVDEVEPAMKDLAQQLQDLNWQGLGFRDLDDYEAPEVLPNGDIILRRKQPTITVRPDGTDDIEL